MLYLVEMSQDRSMPAESDRYAELKAQVCRSLEQLASMPRVTGGVTAGGRSVVFIIDARDHEDLDRQLQEIPLWGVADRTEVTPLVSFGARLQYNTSA